MAEILIIEDEVVLAAELGRYLEAVGHGVRICDRGSAGIESARLEPPDLVLLDLRLPDASGLDILAALVAAHPDLPVILMTAYGSVRDAVDAMHRGARDYLQKPLDLEELALVIERILANQRRDRELHYLRERSRVLPQGIIGRDPRLLAIFEQVQRIAAVELAPGARPAILITGETGTGKGMVAHAIHEILGGGPFVELNCTAMPATLVEAELFGHERGTFTDAKSARPGLFEAADGGAIFLDEIGELDPAVQTKFLKVIEEKRVRRLGALRDRSLDVQVIAATHRDLDAAVETGQFRMDLLHRLRVLSFEIPPLRERPDDLVQLARHFCDGLGRRYRREPCELTPEAEQTLRAYSWPGNVRELRNVLERSILLGGARELDARDLVGLARELPVTTRSVQPGAVVPESAPLANGDGLFVLPESGVDLEAVERDFLRQALERAAGSRTRASALLGLSRHALRYRLEKFGLE